MTVNCMQQSRPVPDIIPSLVSEAKARNLAHITSAPTPPWRFFEQVSRFTNFVARVRQRQITDLEQIIDIASAMDADIEEVGSKILASHPYHILTSLNTVQPDNDILPLGYCHAYTSFASAEMWNGNRTLRLQLNGLIRSVLLIGLTRRPPLFADVEHMMLLQQATDNLRSLSDGIIASVPQYLGYVPVAQAMAAAGAASHPSPDSAGTTPSSTTSMDAAAPPPTGGHSSASIPPSKPLFLWSAFPHSPPHDLGALPLVRSAGGCHLPWALMTASATDVASRETHAWVVKWLDITARQCHIAQATTLARKLREGTLQEGWWRGVCPRDGEGWRPEPLGEGGPTAQLS
ncbi:MAG: hypothetical protein INR71_15730 [Terriglobus roseus]|nr:hypothetical protein [Terriglobus roseus]